jgi:hypothetical protein
MKQSGYEYTAEVPADVVTTGLLQYRIIVQQGNDYTVFPGAVKANPFAWDNYQFDMYETNIAAENSSLELYNPVTDRTVHVVPNFRRGFQTSYISGTTTGKLAFKLSISDMKADELMGFQTFIGDKLKQRGSELSSFDKIIARGRTTNAPSMTIKITLVDKNGFAFGATVPLTNNVSDMEVPLGNFKIDSALLMPRPYPGFQPLYFRSAPTAGVLNLENIEKLEITTPPFMQTPGNKDHGFEIESIKLGKRN